MHEEAEESRVDVSEETPAYGNASMSILGTHHMCQDYIH
jgi:hypothetical protein